MEDGTITLTADDGSEETFFVLSNAEMAGKSYLLVSNSDEAEDESAEALILRAVEDDEIMTYEVLEDENEIKIISKYFEELLEDFELELE